MACVADTLNFLLDYINSQGRPGFSGIQYIGVFNFRYTIFLCLKLGIKYYTCLQFWYRVY